ncbi:MAG: 2-dehydropantoate 2-reductase [Spirochaetota bacterium]|nr:2-dehydropantoate 2-reductase [Spirochaetota bacterium]
MLIFGGGAVGLGIASCLIKSGNSVDIIARKDTVSLLRDYGLFRTGLFGEYHAEGSMFNSYELSSEVQDEEYDFILVCTKSYDSIAVANDLARNINLTQISKIVLFQNGWGNAEHFASIIPCSKIYNARVITGFYRPRKNEVEITVHADAIHIGSLYDNKLEDIKDLCESIYRGGVPCEITHSIEKDLWAKMLYNCALNPLGAIFGVPYGDLGESEYSRRIIGNIVDEIFKVMKGGGCQSFWESSEEYLKVFYEELLPPTARHEASMLQDIREKKRTEIDALNGAVVRLGSQYGIDVRNNMFVYNMIRFIEESFSSE